jgi:hypothetical protein
MENLNQLQKDYLRGQLGHAKFVELAAAAGCTLGQVREFATVVFEERSARQAAAVAKFRAEIAAKDAEIAERFKTDPVAAYELWADYYGSDVDDDLRPADESPYYDEAREHFGDAIADYAENLIMEEIEEQRPEAMQTAWQEYIKEEKLSLEQTA